MRTAVLSALFALILAPAVAFAAPACPSLSLTLRRGSTDARTLGQVTRLQTFLAEFYGLDPETSVSGYFGGLTAANVIRFQRERGLPAQGVAGPLTRSAINTVCEGGENVAAAPATGNYNFSARTVGKNISHVEFTFTSDKADHTPGSAVYDTHYPEYSIDFGDGYKKLWSRSCTEAGVCSGSATHTYKKAGTYTAVLLYSPLSSQSACDTVACRLKTFTRAAATYDITIGTAHSSLGQTAPSVGVWFNDVISKGNVTEVRWESENVNRCVIQYDNIEETVPVEGTKTFLPATTTTYALWCANDIGTDSDGKDVLRPFTVRVRAQ